MDIFLGFLNFLKNSESVIGQIISIILFCSYICWIISIIFIPFRIGSMKRNIEKIRENLEKLDVDDD